MEQYIPKSALVVEIEKLKGKVNDSSSYNNGWQHALRMLELSLNTIEVKEVDLENYNKVKKALSLSFMHFLDANRQEGKMCLSNGECFDIDKAFDEMDFAKLFRYMEKYLKVQKKE